MLRQHHVKIEVRIAGAGHRQKSVVANRRKSPATRSSARPNTNSRASAASPPPEPAVDALYTRRSIGSL